MSDDPVRKGSSEGRHALQCGRAVTTPSFDVLFDLLSEKRRRYALYALTSAEDGLADVETLADKVAMMEAQADDAKLTEAFHADVADSLRETHLPRIAAADIVDYDERSGTVRYWRQPTLEEYLEHTHYKELSDV
ncbi:MULTISPECIES: DUF7344 domain-containing protein [Halorussus]|uniref:DUF7344 domain-containing protein n=1 Tax=Halorussus TaxID=1070314 RepID=UPI0020A217F0|nr:hypothetical protein [Halorussus vallis]USZ76330.1 hypothetical protein NGM07_03140 [Halorussus vallis]